MRRRLIRIVMGAVLVLCLCPPAMAAEATALPEDIRCSAWAREELASAWETGVLHENSGLGSDYTAAITRAQFARLAAETAASGTDENTREPLQEDAGATDGGADTPPVTPFTDTDDPYILQAWQLGIVKGYADGSFRPDGAISRSEAAVMLQRCMTALGRTEANRSPARFSDAYVIPAWAREAVKFCSGRTTAAGKPLMGGSGGLFRPAGRFSIQEAVVTMLRCRESCEVETVQADWRDAAGYDTVEITMSFGGDCTLGRGRAARYAGSVDDMYDKMGAAYFFSNLTAFHTDDLSMVNLEGPLTNWDTPRSQKEFIFKGRPEYVNILTAGSIDVVTIANNHARDYGDRGLQDTVNNLEGRVAVSGYERRPIITVKGVKVGFASNVGWSFDASQKRFITDSIRDLRARGAEIIVFNYHWGEEHVYHSNATQRAIAHYCIDSGADLVIGHHPHVVQETETYKGKQIVYSLGNLCFGGNRNPSDKNCLIFQETFSVNLDTRAVTEISHQALPYRVSSVNQRNDYRPTPA